MLRKLRYKNMLFLLLATIILLVVIGCSSSSGNNKNSSKVDSVGKTEITFWHSATGISLEGMKSLVDSFEEAHPHIKVNMVYAEQDSGSDQKLLTAITGGNPPDISTFDRFKVGSWANQDALTDLTEMAKADGVTADRFYSAAWDEATYEDRLYAMPYSIDSRLLFYNKDHFEEVGLDPENPPTTIKELEEASEKLTIKEGNRFKRIGFIPWYNQGQLYTWGLVFGGEFYNEEIGEVTSTHPKVVEALQWMVDFGNKYNVEDISGFESAAGSDALDPFISGQLSMKSDGNWIVSQIKKFKPDLNYGVTPIPTPTGEDFTTWVGGQSVIIPKGAKNVEAAWEFLSFFGSPEGAKAYFSVVEGDLSVQPVVNEELGRLEDPILKEFVDILPTAHYRPVITEGQLWYNELKVATENATRGIGTPEENLEKVDELVNEALKK